MQADDFIAAGQADLIAGRWAEAQTAFEAALSAAPGDRAAQALDGLGEVLWWLGDPRRSLYCRESAYAGFRATGDTERALKAALGIAVTYQANFGSAAAAGGWVSRAERLLTGPDDPYAGWTAMTRAYAGTDAEQAAASYREALAIARQAGDVDLELCSLSGLGEKLVLLGDVAKGLALLDEAMAGALGGECARLETVAYISCDMLVACDAAADLERARQWCQVADRFIAQYGCPFLSTRCRVVYGSVLVSAGQWAEGEQQLQQAIALSEGAGPALATEAVARLAELRVRQGRIEDAAQLLGGRESELRSCLAVAALRLATGDAAGATTAVRRWLATEAADQLSSAYGLALSVRIHLASGDVEGAESAALALTRLAESRNLPYAEALAAASTAYISSAVDGRAGELWERAVQLFSRLGMPYDAASAQLELARALAAESPEAAAAEATAALATFTRIGARPVADAAAALLRSLGKRPGPGQRTAGELTGRERQVLRLIGLGLSNPEIGARLHISRKTAEHHVSHVLAKLGARNRAEAVARADQG
jgi:ATP/maltotriose-dependent transcriptional regulator MalT